MPPVAGREAVTFPILVHLVMEGTWGHPLVPERVMFNHGSDYLQ